jgi:hypothetical protein
MNLSERPPLQPITCEEIDVRLHQVDQEYWPKIAKFKDLLFYPLSVPIPPHRPLQLMECLQAYASALFKIESDQYEEFYKDGRYPAWLSRLADRLIARVLDAVDKVETGDPKMATLWSHGLSRQAIESVLRESLNGLKNQCEWRDSGPHPKPAQEMLESLAAVGTRAQMLAPMEQLKGVPSADPSSQTNTAERSIPTRLPSVIHSPSAARKIEAYLKIHGIGLTDFAGAANTTDRTLRSFRKTGKVRRDIFESIAKAMGTTKEELLNNKDL